MNYLKKDAYADARECLVRAIHHMQTAKKFVNRLQDSGDHDVANQIILIRT